MSNISVVDPSGLGSAAGADSTSASEFQQALQTADSNAVGETILTPNAIGGGELPSGYSVLTFDMANGNWTGTITLPKQAKDQDAVIIRSAAGYAASVAADNVENADKANLTVVTGTNLLFVYNEESQKWYRVPMAGHTKVMTASQAADGLASISSDTLVLITDRDNPILANLPEKSDYNISFFSAANTVTGILAPNGIVSDSSNTMWVQDKQSYVPYVEIAKGLYQFWYNDGSWTDKNPPAALTPNDLKGGELPSGHSTVTFNLSDGNWVRDITLPQSPSDGDRVVISSGATMTAYIDTANVDTTGGPLELRAGQSHTLVYDASIQKWALQAQQPLIQVPIVLSPDAGSTASYEMTVASEVVLPATAPNWTVLTITSSASADGRIVDGVAYGLNKRDPIIVKPNESYSFEFHDGMWNLRNYAAHELTAAQATANLEPPTAPVTVITISDGDWLPEMKLPDSAGAGDKIIIKSTAAQSTTITGNMHADVQVQPTPPRLPTRPGVEPPPPPPPVNPIGEQLDSVVLDGGDIVTFTWDGYGSYWRTNHYGSA